MANNGGGEMSHFYALVVLPTTKRPASRKAIEGMLDRLLHEYDADRDVPEYETACGCVGWAAKRAGAASAEAIKPIRQYGDEFDAKYPLPAGIKWEWDLPEEEEERGRAIWQEFIGPYAAAAREATKAHPLYEKADPACWMCGGSGKYLTTDNPLRKWDCYWVGGRWTGALSGYKPQEDPKNRRACSLCHGTGQCDDEVSRKLREEDPTFTCNACGGTGAEVISPTEWRHEDDVMLVDLILRQLSERRLPYALVTPDGKWFERGQMGWFGISHNDKPREQWREQVVQLLDRHRDHHAVVVDCHAA